MDHVAVAIGQDLKLDVADAFEQLLDVQGIVTKRRLRLAGRHAKGDGKLVGVVNRPHPLATTAGRRFQEYRVADALGDGARLVDRGDRSIAARRHRYPGRLDHAPSGDLVAHRRDTLGSRADEDDVIVETRPGEMLVLRQKAVAGVDRLGTTVSRDLNDLVDGEIAFARRGWTDTIRLVGVADVERVTVGLGVDRDRSQPELGAGPQHPNRDLAPVRDEHFAERREDVLTHSGMFACFLGGLVSRLFLSSSRPAMIRGRVSRGSITSSTNPRDAAM